MELCTARVATVCPVGRQRAVGCGPASEGGGELLAAPACSLHLDWTASVQTNNADAFVRCVAPCEQQAQSVSDFCRVNRQRLTADANAEMCVAVADSACYWQISTKPAKWWHNLVIFTNMKIFMKIFLVTVDLFRSDGRTWTDMAGLITAQLMVLGISRSFELWSVWQVDCSCWLCGGQQSVCADILLSYYYCC